MLILPIAENLHELLQDSSLASGATLGELGRVMIMAVHFSSMLVITVLCAKYCWTD